MNEATSVLPQSNKEIKFTDKDIERFWSKVNKNGEDCWEWIAGSDRDGYGKFWLDGKEIRAHRAAWLFYSGSLGECGAFVCHKCDNPKCCNPSHLFIGTYRDNIDDMVSKGRTLKGEKCNSSTLKEFEVAEIKRIYATGSVSSRKVAKQFNISKNTVLRIVNGYTWSHSDDPKSNSSVALLTKIAEARRDSCVVNNEDVLKIYNLYFTGAISAQKIGEMFNTSKRTILSIINGGYATRVPLPPHIPSFDALREIAISRRRNQKKQHSQS